MRILLIALAALTVGVTLTVVLIGQRHQWATATAGRDAAPNYSLDDILEIVSDAKTLDDRRERYAVIHHELERFLVAVWDNERSLIDATRNFRELVLAQAPEHDSGFQSVHSAASAEESYARTLMALLWSYAKERPDRPAARARYADLRDQFREAFHTEKDLLPLDWPPAPASVPVYSEGSHQSTPVDCCP